MMWGSAGRWWRAAAGAAVLPAGIMLGACGGGSSPQIRGDCTGQAGGPAPINGAPHQSDLPAQFGTPGTPYHLGANQVLLRITPVAQVGNFGTNCLTSAGVSYIVAKIEYVNPGDGTPVAEWPAWTNHALPVYVQVTRTAVSGGPGGEFDYAILMPSGANDLQPIDNKARHGFSYADPNPTAQRNGATWGVPSEHLNDANYRAEYKRVSGEDVPAPPSSDVNQIHRAYDRTDPLDPAQAAWFSCSQGCCTATGVI